MNEREWGRQLGQAVLKGRDVSALMFVHMAEKEEFDDTTVIEHADLFVAWDENWTGKVGAIVQDEGRLYRKINADFNNPYPQSKPSADKSQWKLIGDPGEEWPEWSQPIGAHDAYSKGDKVTHKQKRWISDADNNTWEPGVYGWTEA